MDIPAELLREHLTEATKYNDEHYAFDPYAGNLLGSVVASDANNRQHAYIAFPVGEVKSDLSRCSFFSMFHFLNCFFQICLPYFVLKRVNLPSGRPPILLRASKRLYYKLFPRGMVIVETETVLLVRTHISSCGHMAAPLCSN